MIIRILYLNLDWLIWRNLLIDEDLLGYLQMLLNINFLIILYLHLCIFFLQLFFIFFLLIVFFFILDILKINSSSSNFIDYSSFMIWNTSFFSCILHNNCIHHLRSRAISLIIHSINRNICPRCVKTKWSYSIWIYINVFIIFSVPSFIVQIN